MTSGKRFSDTSWRGPLGMTALRINIKPKPYWLITPDIEKYLKRFWGFDFWEVAPVTEEVLIREADIGRESVSLIGSEREPCSKSKIDQDSIWLAWFACQTSEQKMALANKACSIGKAYLKESCHVLGNGIPDVDREPNTLGAYQHNASAYERGQVNFVILPEERLWIAWYACQTNFYDEHLAATAWNSSTRILHYLNHTRDRQTKTITRLKRTVVFSQKEKSLLTQAIEKARIDAGFTADRVSLFERLTGTGKDEIKVIPTWPITRSELDEIYKRKCATPECVTPQGCELIQFF